MLIGFGQADGNHRELGLSKLVYLLMSVKCLGVNFWGFEKLDPKLECEVFRGGARLLCFLEAFHTKAATSLAPIRVQGS